MFSSPSLANCQNVVVLTLILQNFHQLLVNNRFSECPHLCPHQHYHPINSPPPNPVNRHAQPSLSLPFSSSVVSFPARISGCNVRLSRLPPAHCLYNCVTSFTTHFYCTFHYSIISRLDRRSLRTWTACRILHSRQHASCLPRSSFELETLAQIFRRIRRPAAPAERNCRTVQSPLPTTT